MPEPRLSPSRIEDEYLVKMEGSIEPYDIVYRGLICHDVVMAVARHAKATGDCIYSIERTDGGVD